MTRYQKLIILFLTGIIIGLAVSLVVVKRRDDIASARRVYVYFLEYDHEAQMPLLRPFIREITYTRELREKVMLAFSELSIGPGEDLRSLDITSSYPEGLVPDSVRVDGDLVYLDFPASIEEGGGSLTMYSRLAQIVYTATQFPELEKVMLLIEGSEKSYFGGEGLTLIEKPMRRRDFSDYVGVF